jgi:hypothetical protein
VKAHLNAYNRKVDYIYDLALLCSRRGARQRTWTSSLNFCTSSPQRIGFCVPTPLQNRAPSAGLLVS